MYIMHHEKILKNLRKISQKRHSRILIWAVYCILTSSSNDNNVHNQKNKKILAKSPEACEFELLGLHHFKFRIPIARG